MYCEGKICTNRELSQHFHSLVLSCIYNIQYFMLVLTSELLHYKENNDTKIQCKTGAAFNSFAVNDSFMNYTYMLFKLSREVLIKLYGNQLWCCLTVL